MMNHFILKLNTGRILKNNKIIPINFKKFSTSIPKVRIQADVCFYKLLNLTPNSTIEEIKKEYYKLAKKYHPDNKENSSANQTVGINLTNFLF